MEDGPEKNENVKTVDLPGSDVVQIRGPFPDKESEGEKIAHSVNLTLIDREGEAVMLNATGKYDFLVGESGMWFIGGVTGGSYFGTDAPEVIGIRWDLSEETGQYELATVRIHTGEVE